MARRVVHQFYDEVEAYGNPRGGTFHPGLLVWTLYDHWADSVGALPDGRRRGEAMASSIGPRDAAGIASPTAVLQGVTAFDHRRCAGGLTLNLRFDGRTACGEAGLTAIGHLLVTYFEQGGMQVQLNVVDSRALREAQRDPEAHADLVVRVSGFSARFVDLGRRMQEEIIARAAMMPA
jgi:formate C-acetyltransferase